MPIEVFDRITYPFSHFNGCTADPTFCNGCNYLSILGLKLFHVTKMAQKVWCSTVFQQGVLVIITLTKTLTLYHILVFQQFFLFAIYPMRPAEDQNIPSGTKLPHFKTMIAWWPHRFRRLNIKILLPWLLCHMAPFKTDIPAAIPVVMGSDKVPGATVLG